MITSVHNPRVQRARKLLKRAFRSEQREFLVEGVRPVREGLEAQAPLQALFVDTSRGPEVENLAGRAQARSIQVDEVSPEVMNAMSGTTTAPGIMAVCRFIDKAAEDLIGRRLSLVTILGHIRDPGNAATIVRTSRAAGADAVFVAAETVDIYNPKFVRASAGALFWVPLARDIRLRWLLGELGKYDINRVAADPRAECVYDQADMIRPTAFLVGNEAWGLPPGLAGLVDQAVSIPMARSSESLNVAIATAVLLFEAARQRRNNVIG